MPLLSRTAGSTSQSIPIKVYDSTNTAGTGLTGLVYNTAGLTAYYKRQGDAASTAITLATMTVGTWSTGGFKEIDATFMPGHYEFGIPDAALATGATWVTFTFRGAANMAPVDVIIELDRLNYQDPVRAGLTALPNVAAGANGGLPTGNGSGQVAVATIATDAVNAASLATDAVTEIQSGLATAASQTTIAGYIDTEVAAIKAKTDNLPATPAAVGSAMTLAANSVNAAALAADAVTEIQTGLVTEASLTTIAADASTAATVATAIATTLDEAMGLLGKHVVISDTTYDGTSTRLLSYTIKLYDTAGHATLAGVTGLLHTYNVVNTYDVDGRLDTCTTTRAS